MMNQLVKVTITVLLGFMFTFCADAQNQALSVDDVLVIFYQRNLDLIAARYNVDQSVAEAVVAAAIPNPSVSFQLGELSSTNLNKGSSATGCNHNSSVSCGPSQYYSFSQLIEVAGKRGLRVQSSDFAIQAAESDFRDAVRIFTNVVRTAYYQLLQMQKNLWLAQEIVDHYQVVTEANSLRLKSGDISESDFLRVKMEGVRAQSDLDSAQSAVTMAQADLAVILRWPERSLQFEAKEQWPEIKDMGQQLTPDELINKALSLRPDLQADKLRAEQADKQLELAKRLKYPDVTVTGGYAKDPSNNALDSGFVGFSVPLPIFYQYKGEEDKASVNLSQSRVTAEQTELEVKNDVVES